MSETIGLAIIAKDEEKNILTLLTSISGAFDQVVLVDTGSTDRTVEVFESWANTQDGMDYRIAHFEWCNDFAAARNYADTFLWTDWHAWADCDDIVVGAQELRRVVANVQPGIKGLIFGYDYAQEPESGRCICFLKRERLVRSGYGKWHGRVHEAQTVDGQTMYVPPEITVWRHMKQVAVRDVEEASDKALASNDRNLEILYSWYEDDPTNPRVLAYLGTELAAGGKHEYALPYYKLYLEHSDGGWRDEYAQVMRKYAASLCALERVDEAKALAFRSMEFHPKWPDGYITAAECALLRDDFEAAEQWISLAQLLGVPRETMLIINPLDYTFLPHRMMAYALAGQGRYEQALEAASHALQEFPEAALMYSAREWEAIVKRDKTAQAFIEAARVLVNHDEQWKARKLIEECVPHYCNEQPAIVAFRSEVRERTLWATDPEAFAEHYRTGGSKPEDFLDDETSDKVAAALPRAAFLVDGILDQVGVE